MNFNASDIIKILRLFGVANDDNQPRQIERLDKQQPIEAATCISFNFLKHQYLVYIDNNAEDDEVYINQMILSHTSDDQFKLLPNPTVDGLLTYGLPFNGKDIYLLKQSNDEVRLDSALVERIGGYSRSSFQKLIQKGQVLVNGQVELTAKRKIKPDDVIEVNDQPVPNTELPPIEIIFEDDDVLVINKPVGLLTHAKGELTEEVTAADYVAHKTSYKPETNRPGIIHRLDRATSGVLLMAKTEAAAKLISRQFSDRKAHKTYTAIISGQPQQPTAKIDLPIGRNPSSPSTFRVDPNGKPAETTYTVKSSTDTYSLVTLKPKTGRTHQLRVHMKYIGCPIVGDKVYGGLEADRMYLHATELEVTLPGGRRQTFTAPLPAEFTDYLRQN